MSYTLSTRLHRTKRSRCCVWCGEPILPGLWYKKHILVDGGDFWQQDWHPECYDGSGEVLDGDDEFEPRTNERINDLNAIPEAPLIVEEYWDPYPEDNNEPIF